MAKVDVSAYLERIGLSDRGPPSGEALAALHRAHVERVPYETLEIHLRRPNGIDPYESVERIIRKRQGGYCFHLNGAFALLLSALGYHVTWHRSGVQSRRDRTPVGANANHLGLVVHGLPTTDCPEGRWIVDVGLGDALYEPVPLRPGTYTQGPFSYTVRRSDVETRSGRAPSADGQSRVANHESPWPEPHGWRLDHDPRGVFIGVDFAPEQAVLADFLDQHVRLSTSPDSGFVRVLTAQRRHAKGVDALRGCVLTQLDETGRTITTFDRASDWFDALADIFGLTLPGVAPAQRESLWRHVRQSHQDHATPAPAQG